MEKKKSGTKSTMEGAIVYSMRAETRRQCFLVVPQFRLKIFAALHMPQMTAKAPPVFHLGSVNVFGGVGEFTNTKVTN